MTGGLLTNVEVAALAGVKPSTWRKYVSQGRAPQPDDRVAERPLWRADTVAQWLEGRPGQGRRTDLSPGRPYPYR